MIISPQALEASREDYFSSRVKEITDRINELIILDQEIPESMFENQHPNVKLAVFEEIRRAGWRIEYNDRGKRYYTVKPFKK